MANALYLGNAGMMGTPNVNPVPAGPSPVKPGREVPPVAPAQGSPNSTPPNFDSSYLQNLATYIGSLFSSPSASNTGNVLGARAVRPSGPSGDNVMSFNPLGTLNEISPPSGQIGNAPGFGAPLTWLQQALSGGGFGFTPTPAPATAGSGVGFGGGSGGGGFPRGPRQLTL